MNFYLSLMRRATVSVATLLLCASGSAALAAGPKSGGYEFPRIEALAALYPDDCSGKSVEQGLCLLGSVDPKLGTEFVVRQVGATGRDNALPIIETDKVYKAKLNKRLALPPGIYEIFRRADETDGFYKARFAVTAGQVFTLKTATLRFDGKGLYLQYIMAKSPRSDRRCQTLGKSKGGKSKGVEAVLPGIYYVTLQKPKSNADSCSRSGFDFHLSPGEAVEMRVGTIKKEHLLEARHLTGEHTYRHHSGALALTNIGGLRHEVTSVGLVSDFKSFNGVHNPSDRAVDALVLWGPHFAFVIPMRVNATPSCGRSLAKSGVPARNLLTHCMFDDEGRLTDFQVNSRVYFGYTNVNGLSGPSAHLINDPFKVRGLAWFSNNQEED